MHFDIPSISHQRLQRLRRWALLCLRWFVASFERAAAQGPLPAPMQKIGHSCCDMLERVLTGLVIVRASQYVRRAPSRAHRVEPLRKRRGVTRAILGASLRRALRARDLHTRVARLRTIDLDALIVHVLKRLPRGLTRRCAITARPEPNVIAITDACVAAALAIDSS